MKSIEEVIAATVNKAVEKAMEKQRAQIKADIIAALRQELPNVAPQGEDEQLITIKEAASRLQVSVAKVNSLIADGQIKKVVTPNGRKKVMKSSLNNYIRGAAV